MTLDQLHALVQRMTPGEWDTDTDYGTWPGTFFSGDVRVGSVDIGGADSSEATAAGIVALRNMAEALIEAGRLLKGANGVIDALRRASYPMPMGRPITGRWPIEEKIDAVLARLGEAT